MYWNLSNIINYEPCNGKRAYLRYQINMLETEKTEAMNHLFKLKRMIYELQSSLAQKRDMALMNGHNGEADPIDVFVFGNYSFSKIRDGNRLARKKRCRN